MVKKHKQSLLLVILFMVLALFIRSGAIALLGLVIAVAIPLAKWRDAMQCRELERRQIQRDFPALLTKLSLLLAAGETLKGSIVRCAPKQPPVRAKYILLYEWYKVSQALQHGRSFSSALDQLSRSCRCQEVSFFVTTLLLNEKRGGAQLAAALYTLAQTLWEQRKMNARLMGEQLASKLVFPLMAIFIVIMMIVGAPALFSIAAI